MNLKEIKEMIQLMNENNLNEIELERDGLKIRLVRGQQGVVQELAQRAVGETVASGVESKTPKETAGQEKEKYIQIKAPMVGTFYKAVSPDAPPFVELGDVINAGDVVCIIEAMKLMNEIKSEVKGKIKEILVENGEPIEFGQPLFLIEPE
ncbi:MAG: acetyl-CoA carboxylase biotin carboxyl carrier protein [Candidatus Omnitrophica bacterium]|nr:acetyl-CoA carboxylase biotin carboxyl carrier protein [Candidatus Omnitrophota bacterium]